MVDWTTIREKAGPYPQAAFEFVRQGLEHTAVSVHGAEAPAPAEATGARGGDGPRDEGDADQPNRHVTGQQLCLGLKDLAQKKYGRLARLVLILLSILRTDDFGRIVFAMIDSVLVRGRRRILLEPMA